MTSLPLIAVDIGNSSIKLGWFASLDADVQSELLPTPDQTSSVSTRHWLDESPTEKDPISQAIGIWLPPSPCQWLASSVHRSAEKRLAQWVAEHRPQDCYHALTSADLKIDVAVERPDQVGIDRLIAVLGANALRRPDRSAIVVDLGTAITVDFLSKDGRFLGGAILPSFTTAARALATQTDALPMVKQRQRSDQPPQVVGTSTVEAIRSGLFWGLVGAINELRRQSLHCLQDAAEGQSVEPDAFLTGGGAEAVAGFLDFTPKLVPNLVLRGIGLVHRQRRMVPR